MLEVNKIYNIDCLDGINNIKIPDLIICDPPYEFEAMGGGIHKVGNGGDVRYQDIIDIGTNHFDFDKFIPKIIDIQKDKVNAYFFCNKTLIPKYLNLAIERNLFFDILTMNKKNPLPAKDSSYLPEIEYIIFLRSKGTYFNGKLSYNNYFKSHFINIGHNNNKHPNEKPKSIIRKFIKISSKENDLVLDAFIGSGTTALVCKELNRNFIGFEINKDYFELANNKLLQNNLLSFEKLNNG